MRKLLTLVLISTLLFIAACSSSSNSGFHKELEKANDFMNEMKYEEALEVLNKLKTDFLPKDKYEAGRTELVDQLIRDAEYMATHIESLKSDYESAMEVYEETKSTDEVEFNLYEEALNAVNYTLNQFNDMQQLDMYQELVDARDDLLGKIENLVDTLVDSFEKSLDEQNFAQAENDLDQLWDIHYRFDEDAIDYEVLDEYAVKLQEQLDRFVFTPDLFVEWNEEIIKDELGTIQFKGVKNANNNIYAAISFQGDYAKILDELTFRTEIIYGNGDARSGSSYETRYYKDETIVVYQFGAGEGLNVDDILRFIIEVPAVEEEAIRIAFENVDLNKDYVLPGLLAISGEYRPNITIVEERFDIEIHEILVDKYNIEISGFIKPKVDGQVNELNSVYIPLSQQRRTSGTGWFGASYMDLYEGTQKEFNYSYSFNEPITEEDEFISFRLFDHNIFINLKTGDIEKLTDPYFIGGVYYSTSNTTVGYRESEKDTFINQNGDRTPAETVLAKGSAYGSFYIGNNFETFSATLTVPEDRATGEYGTTEVVFYSVMGEEETEIASFTVKENHKPMDIEVDITGVKVLKIELNPDSGNRGRQFVLIENAVVK